jgi:PAS domain S-box-containing protein
VTTVDELTLSIGDLARRTGVDIPTLRRWERYEGLLAPARTPGGQRRYGRRDVEALEEVVGLVDRGWPPASAAKVVAAHRDTGAVVFDAELFDALPVGVVITNADFEVLYANPHLAALLGADPDEVETAITLDLLDEQSRVQLGQVFGDVRHGHETASIFRVRTRGGETIELEAVVGPLLGTAGRIRGAIGIVQPARPAGRTGSSEAEVAQQLLDVAGVALVAVDRAGTVLAWSDAAASAFATSGVEWIGRPLAELLPDELATPIAAAVSRAVTGGEAGSFTVDDIGDVRVQPLLVDGQLVGATVAIEPAAATSQGFAGVIATISQALLRGDEVQTILDTTVAGIARGLGADHVAFVQLARSTNELAVLAATGGATVGASPMTGPFGSHVAFALQAHRPIVVRDFATERRFDRGPLPGEQTAASGLCVPVQWSGGGDGAVCAHSSTTSMAMTSNDVGFVQAAANLCAVALDRRADRA